MRPARWQSRRRCATRLCEIQSERDDRWSRKCALLNLGFAEFDVLAHDRVVLLDHHLLGHGAGVLLGHVEVAGVRRGVEANLDGSWLGHGALTGWAGARPEIGRRGQYESRPRSQLAGVGSVMASTMASCDGWAPTRRDSSL